MLVSIGVCVRSCWIWSFSRRSLLLLSHALTIEISLQELARIGNWQELFGVNCFVLFHHILVKIYCVCVCVSAFIVKSQLHVKDLMDAINYMHDKKMYKKVSLA